MSIFHNSCLHRIGGVSVAFVAATAVLSCNEPRPAAGEPAAVASPPEASPTRILVDLPAGIEVALNGRARGVTPLPALDVEPGSYTVTLAAGCKSVDVQLEAAAHETTTVDLERAAGLGPVTLEITARNLTGEPLEHAVALDDEVLGGGKGRSSTAVPPCKARVKVSSEGLGGFIEDIDFSTQPEVQREIVLTPGPDMVRIRGGKFTLGPPDAIKERWMREETDLMFPQILVEMHTFDIDRTEVTAAQWMACRKAGGCPERRELWWTTQLPGDRDLPYCNVNTIEPEPVMVEGREQHPMNCVARWEAEDYCEWAGKRLPDADEWEYAARSTDDRNLWPWGLDPYTCEHGKTSTMEACRVPPGTDPVCTHPKGNSAQGVCDLAGNVQEYAHKTARPHPDRDPDDFTCIGSGWREHLAEPFRGSPCLGRPHQESNLGFRCVRDTAKEISQ